MKELYTSLADFAINYPLKKKIPLEKALFLDIETTGFTAHSSYLYLIGCAYYEKGSWHIRQWFAQNYQEEAALLKAFFDFAQKYSYLIHFNGNHFDLPFLLQKCEILKLPYNFDHFEGLDLYRRIAPYKYFLKLPNCKQKTIEQFLGIQRDDLYNGGELIDVYHDYVKKPSAQLANDLLLHNRDDIKGMLQCLPVLAYYDLFHSPVTVKKVQANSYKDIDGNKCQELFMTVNLPIPLPAQITASSNGCYFKGNGSEGQIRVPIYEEELKYYYANYRDYYYLPAEDVALHKSVGSFVDKEHRVQATAATCYTRKYSTYLPQWDTVIEPFFKREAKSKELFFELTEELKTNRDAFCKYAHHILAMLSDKSF